MQPINALFLTSNVRDWLATSQQPRVLHVFDHACNLINERREVLSSVTPEIGNGPFNLVVETDFLFNEHLSLESPVSVSADQLVLGDIIIHTEDAKLWDPTPNWDRLHSNRDNILRQLTILPIANYPFPISPVSSLSSSLAKADFSSSLEAARKLAGLGAGLTPAGDDFIMGALHAAWIIHPRNIISDPSREIAESAAGLTTSLSAAWIRSAGRGEAGELWHALLDALAAGSESRIQRSIEQILSVGETSGADALAGFFGVFANVIDHPDVPKSP